MIAGYVVAGLLLLLILVAAYRALGRPSAPVNDPLSLLRAVRATAANAAAQLVQAGAPGGKAAQRALEGCALSLERLDTGELGGAYEAARALLAQGVHELIWAARLGERSGMASDGLRRAFEELVGSGTGCLERAGAELDGSVAAKEHDRSL